MTAGGDSASSTQQPLGPKALQPELGSSSTGEQEELMLFLCVFHKSPTESRNGVNSRDVGRQPKAEHSYSLVGKQGRVSRGHRSNVPRRRSGQGSLIHREFSVSDIQMLINSKQHIASLICIRKEK